MLARTNLVGGDAEQAFIVCDRALGGVRSENVQSSKCSELLLCRGRARIALSANEDARTDLERVASLGGLGTDAKRELAEAFTHLGLQVPTARTLNVPKTTPPSGHRASPIVSAEASPAVAK